MVKKVLDKDMSAPTFPPDRPAEVGRMLFEGWLEKVGNDERRAKAADTLMRASNAGMCTRRLFFQIDDEDADEPTGADLWRMRLGTMVHSEVEEHMIPMLLEQGTDAGWHDIVTEPKFDLSDQGISLSGHGDIEVTDADDQKGVIEIKTVNGFKFKVRAFTWQGGPAGPEAYHVRQVGLAMAGRGADWAAIVYVSMENMGAKELGSAGKTHGIEMEDLDRFLAEWVFTREELQPVITDELRRLELVTKAHDRGLAAGKIPRVVVIDGPALGGRNVEITDPMSGSWEVRDTEGNALEVGTTWQCKYCPFTTQCLEAGDG